MLNINRHYHMLHKLKLEIVGWYFRWYSSWGTTKTVSVQSLSRQLLVKLRVLATTGLCVDVYCVAFLLLMNGSALSLCIVMLEEPLRY